VKKSILYALIIILFVVALISLRLGKGNKTINIDKTENRIKLEEDRGNWPVFPIGQNAQPQVPLSKNRPAITIINTMTPVKIINKNENNIIKRIIPKDISPASSLGFETETEADEDVTGEGGGESAGMTIINQYPSETEKKEMDERGIVIY